MKNFLFTTMMMIFGSSTAFALNAKQWIQETLPESLKQNTASPTDRLDYLKQQGLPEGISLSDVIDAILDME